jgi:sarcosine oxidase
MAAEQLVYDFCVVGGGLWGSACCYHLLKQLPASATIAFIAPSEPVASAPSQHWGWDDQHEGVYSAHYDEGRITRELDSDETWSRLASASIRCYRDIETNSRVSFYTEAGYLCLGTQAQDAYVRKVEAVGKAVRCDFTTLVGATDIQDRFPSLKVDDTAIGLHQARNAGHISPRRLVSALRTVIQQHEPTVLETYATRVDVIDGTAAVQLANGQTLRAQKVIVAPGAFIEASLCNGWQPPVHVSGRTVVLKDVTDLMDDESLQLSTLPSIISCSTPKAPGTPLLYDTYQLPPIMYPDGRWYLKVGPVLATCLLVCSLQGQ